MTSVLTYSTSNALPVENPYVHTEAPGKDQS